MNDGFIDMNGLMLLRKAIGILIELIVKMKVGGLFGQGPQRHMGAKTICGEA